MRTTIQLGLLVLFLRAASAQTQPKTHPDAAEIIRKVSETYKNVSQYGIESATNIRDPKTGREASGVARVAFKGPDKYQQEVKGTLLNWDRDPTDPIIDEVIDVYDGSNLRVYMPKSKEYRDYIVPNLPRNSRPEDFDLYTGIGLFRLATEAFAKIDFLREDRITTEGGSVDCFVLGVAPIQAVLWIDKRTYHVLRMEGEGVSQVFKTIKLDQPISDDLFKWAPPPDARKLDKPSR